MSWLIPFSELSSRQQQAVELPPHQPRFIVGPPGSGKTQVLLHRAAFLRDNFLLSDRYCVFVFTNALKDYIRAACDDLGIPADRVTTFDAWCAHYYERRISRRLPWDAQARQRDFGMIREAVARDAASLGEPLLDVALVDEGQDLDHAAYDVLRAIARHVTVCADYKQQIYAAGSSEDEIAQHLGLRRSNLTLLDAFRCSPYLVPLAASFIANQQERLAFVGQTRTARGARETPVLCLANDFDEERALLADTVRSRLIQGERIGILFPRKRMVYGFAQGMRGLGLEVEVPAERGSDVDGLDFASDRPKLLTYHGAKGLTFDSVLLPRLVDQSFLPLGEDEIEHLLFVGITRAVRWVYMSAVGRDALPILERLGPLAAAGDLTIRHGRSTSTSSAPPAGLAGQDIADGVEPPNAPSDLDLMV